MKILPLLVSILICVGCTNVYIGPDDVDPYLLMDYNVILHKHSEGHPICGATLVNFNTIVTAAHCVTANYEFHIEPSDGNLYPVDIVAMDYFETTDLAVLRTKTPVFQPVATVASGEPKPLDEIYVIGCGGGECDAFSRGVVSKLDVICHHEMVMNQFDVTAWYGNSGGGIFDTKGRLVGVVSQFGPQFDRGWYGGEPETGWMYGCTATAINTILEEAESVEGNDTRK